MIFHLAWRTCDSRRVPRETIGSHRNLRSEVFSVSPVNCADAPPLTLLYVPANRPDRIEKALQSSADVVAIDLEDAVAPDHKEAGRREVLKLLGDRQVSRAIQIRINPRGSDWHEADLACFDRLDPSIAIRLPKTSSGEDVLAVRRRTGERQIHALIESALGVERAFEIAQAHVTTIGLGEADLRSSLGLPAGQASDHGLTWSRARIVNAAAAAGLVPPLMSVHTLLRDVEGLRRSSELGRRLGFMGRTAIHPVQLETIREAFRPAPAEVSAAREALARIEGARIDGAGTVVLPDGSFLDSAMVESARRTVAIASSLE